MSDQHSMHADPPWVGRVRAQVKASADAVVTRHPMVHTELLDMAPQARLRQLNHEAWQRIALAFGEITHALPDNEGVPTGWLVGTTDGRVLRWDGTAWEDVTHDYQGRTVPPGTTHRS